MTIRAFALCSAVVVLIAACTESPDPRIGAERPTLPDRGPKLELTRTRIPLPGQPATVLYDRGSLWVGGSLLVRMVDDKIVQRLLSGISRVGTVRFGKQLWVTGGGDGGVPDGSVVAYDTHTGRRVERLVFPSQSPYGIDADERSIFVALFQGDLVRIDSEGEPISSVPLSYGLTQVLAARDKIWVSSPQRGKVWHVVFNARDDTAAAATNLKEMAKRSCPQGLDAADTAIWVADPCARKVWLLDARTGDVTNVIDELGRPIDVAVTKNYGWIVSLRHKLVSVVDVRTLESLAHAPLQGAAIAAHGREAWVANHEGFALIHLKLSKRDG